jgi:hypothetical protein
MTENKPTPKDIFMPENGCARCENPFLNLSSPTLLVRFKDSDKSSYLTFCSEKCKKQFVQGMEAMQGDVQL